MIPDPRLAEFFPGSDQVLHLLTREKKLDARNFATLYVDKRIQTGRRLTTEGDHDHHGQGRTSGLSDYRCLRTGRDCNTRITPRIYSLHLAVRALTQDMDQLVVLERLNQLELGYKDLEVLKKQNTELNAKLVDGRKKHENDIATLHEKIDKLNTVIASRAAEAQEAAEETAEEVAKVVKQLGALKADNVQLKKEVSILKKQVSDVKVDNTQLKKRVRENHNALTMRINRRQVLNDARTKIQRRYNIEYTTLLPDTYIPTE